MRRTNKKGERLIDVLRSNLSQPEVKKNMMDITSKMTTDELLDDLKRIRPMIQRAKTELNDLESQELAIIATLYDRGGLLEKVG
jgi:predicted Zn-ribbon and HTH transcriptional regulator